MNIGNIIIVKEYKLYNELSCFISLKETTDKRQTLSTLVGEVEAKVTVLEEKLQRNCHIESEIRGEAEKDSKVSHLS